MKRLFALTLCLMLLVTAAAGCNDTPAEDDGAPKQELLLQELENYVTVVGSALAMKDGEKHPLVFNVRDADWRVDYEKDATTATLYVTYSSDKLSFEGYYSLTLTEGKWTIDSLRQDDFRNHPLLHLTSLEQE